VEEENLKRYRFDGYKNKDESSQCSWCRSSVSSSPKKGSTITTSHMPQQVIADAHCKVNEERAVDMMNPNGVNHDPSIVSEEAGSVL
jgi:hypothetical protein